MHKILVLLVFHANLLLFCRGCAFLTDRPISEEIKKNLRTPWLVLIMDESLETATKGIGYGALIAEDKVLTLAKTVDGHSLSNLYVQADNKMFSPTEIDLPTGVLRQVNSQINVNNNSEGKNRKNDIALLSLSEPFELSERVTPIKLLSDKYINDYDPHNCSIYHWHILYNKQDNNGAWVSVEYRASLAHDESFGINKDDQVNKMSLDSDCIVADCVDVKSNDLYKTGELSFLGTPVVCSLKSNPEQLIQAGFATYIYRIYPPRSPEIKKAYKYIEGSLVDFSPMQEEFHDATDHAFDN